GHPRMLEAARGPHFRPGALCSESGVGTNAIGTAIALDHAVQIFSAEHFNRLLHGWTCAAAPVHDPVTGAILGVIDLSGSFRTAHPHTLALVSAVARAAELQLARERVRRDAELVARYVDRLSAAGRGRCLYGGRASPVTVRAEVARLRRVVGDLVDAQPYRLTAEVRADFLEVERLLARGRVAAALDRYAGPLLPRSRAPCVVARREALAAAVARARVATPRNPPRIRVNRPAH